MEQLSGAQILVQALLEQGIDTVFGYPGGMVLDIYDALYDHRDQIRHVETTHEQHAAHAADGYARSTGRTGVVIATSGPGATNLVTGIAAAHLDSVPLVAITGNVANGSIGTDAFQELDITGVTLPITKHNYFVHDVEQLHHIVREAFALAASGRPGPVLIDIPKDVQVATCDFEPAAPLPVAEPTAPEEDVLRKAAELIGRARRPYIYFGGGVVTSGAGELVAQLAERIDAPMGCSLMGLSAVPSDNPRFLGMQGMHGHYASTMAMHRADCVIALGVRFNERATGDRGALIPDAKIIRVDVDSSEFSKTTVDRCDLLGDVRLTLERLMPLVKARTHPAWHLAVSGFVADEKGLADSRDGLVPARIMEVLDRHLAPDTIVVTDVGQHQMWAAQHLHRSVPRTFVTSGGLGAMGFGLGAAIGAQLATGRRVVLVTGDGSFAMNMAELITAADNQVPVAVLLLNNRTLGMVRQQQTVLFGGRHSCTTLDRVVDYAGVARAMGAVAYSVASLHELDQALDVALATDGPTLVECPVGIDELVLPMLVGAGDDERAIVSPDDIDYKAGAADEDL